LTLLGGVGLFLIGMGQMTDGLTQLGGHRIKRALSGLGRYQAFFMGLSLTALVQSSSATTLITIGLVSAGLMTFPTSLSIIFGANLGTTSTAWIVATFGLKVSISAFAWPFVATGALLKLFSKGRHSVLGMAIAGFGLMFIGLDVMQASVGSLGPALMPDHVPSGFLGRALLVLIGALMTVIMQSSAAAIAVTLTALHAGILTLEHATCLVIGQNIGTTITAGLASIGATVEAKRAALAHTLFNIGSALPALALLDALAWLITHLSSQDTTQLAIFHSLFNILGICIFFPLMAPFARVIQRLVPDRAHDTLSHLDDATLQIPSVAVEVARNATLDLCVRVIRAVQSLLPDAPLSRDDPKALHHAQHAFTLAQSDITTIRHFLSRLRTTPSDLAQHQVHVSTLHALDHLQRLIETVHEPHHRASLPHALLLPTAQQLRFDLESLDFNADDLRLPSPASDRVLLTSEATSRRLADARRTQRASLLSLTAEGDLSPEDADSLLQALRWLDRIAYHAWRAIAHLGASSPQRGTRPSSSSAQ
jgi:phosphate:Na+ symporter